MYLHNFNIKYNRMSNKITEILETDNKYRHHGVIGDIFTIDSLKSDKSLDYDYPTLVNHSFDYNNSNKLCNNIEQFKTNFYKKYPFLTGIDMSNLLIAGGCVGNIVQNKQAHNFYDDIDIDFFVTENQKW
jgi:predicted NodU family carbamoyl transferase